MSIAATEASIATSITQTPLLTRATEGEVNRTVTPHVTLNVHRDDDFFNVMIN